MKTRDGSALDLARGNRFDDARPPRTEEFELPDEDDDHLIHDDLLMDDDARPRAIRDEMKTAEVDVVRDRRVTVASGIPAVLAEEMVRERKATPRQQPATPLMGIPEDTRRVGAGVTPTLSPAGGLAPWRQRAAQRIDEARAAMDAGDLAFAVLAAEAALHEADTAPAPGIIEVIEPARPLLNRVLNAYVGPTSGVPILAAKADDVAPRLPERDRALLRRVDGLHTLEELFDGSGLGAMDALRVVARLIRAGAIRIV